MSKQPVADTLTVIARAPFEVFYEGPAKAVSATNRVGQFDVLPGHADFFSMLSAGDVTVLTDGEPVTFSITRGIITVRDDNAMLFVNM